MVLTRTDLVKFIKRSICIDVEKHQPHGGVFIMDVIYKNKCGTRFYGTLVCDHNQLFINYKYDYDNLVAEWSIQK